jgi:hypothetical protein
LKTLIAITLVAATAGCVSARPQLRNVSIEADVSTQISGSETYMCDAVSYGGGHLGRIAVVLDQPVTRTLTYRLGLEHRSLLDTSQDRGEERAIAGFVWRPFR